LLQVSIDLSDVGHALTSCSCVPAPDSASSHEEGGTSQRLRGLGRMACEMQANIRLRCSTLFREQGTQCVGNRQGAQPYPSGTVLAKAQGHLEAAPQIQRGSEQVEKVRVSGGCTGE
jgi:hypothetical protein